MVARSRAPLHIPQSMRSSAPMQRIVVDAMGGDHAPSEIVKGAAEASLALPSAEIILVGAAAEPASCCRGSATTAPGPVHPRRQRGSRWTRSRPRRWPPSPTRRSRGPPIGRLRRGRRDGVGGNTGASVLDLRAPLEADPRGPARGVDRLSTELRRGEKDDPFSLMLDVGATIDPRRGTGHLRDQGSRTRGCSRNKRRGSRSVHRRERQGPAAWSAPRSAARDPERNFIGNIPRGSTSRAASPTSSCALGSSATSCSRCRGRDRDVPADGPLRPQAT